jgi:hypothetical protein
MKTKSSLPVIAICMLALGCLLLAPAPAEATGRVILQANACSSYNAAAVQAVEVVRANTFVTTFDVATPVVEVTEVRQFQPRVFTTQSNAVFINSSRAFVVETPPVLVKQQNVVVRQQAAKVVNVNQRGVVRSRSRSRCC